MRPRVAPIPIEFPAEDDHQIYELADVALARYSVSGGAFDAVLDQFSKLSVTQRHALGGEKLRQMVDHPVLELPDLNP